MDKQIVIDVLLSPEVDIAEKHALLFQLADKIYTQEGTHINNDRWLWIRDALQADYTAAPLVPVLLIFVAIDIHESLKKAIIDEYNQPDYIPPIFRDHEWTPEELTIAKGQYILDFFGGLSSVLALFRSSDPILVSEKVYIVLQYITDCWMTGVGELPTNITTPPRPKAKASMKAAVKRKGVAAARQKK